jgi:hypothetical protein
MRRRRQRRTRSKASGCAWLAAVGHSGRCSRPGQELNYYAITFTVEKLARGSFSFRGRVVLRDSPLGIDRDVTHMHRVQRHRTATSSSPLKSICIILLNHLPYLQYALPLSEAGVCTLRLHLHHGRFRAIQTAALRHSLTLSPRSSLRVDQVHPLHGDAQ